MGFFRKKPKPAQAEFEQAVLPHLDSLYGAALRLTRSPSNAEDLVQDALVKAFRFHESFEAGTNMKAWLLRILRNTFINRYRRKRREREVFDGPGAGAVGDGVMSRDTMRALTAPLELAERRLLAKEIEAALDELPEEHRLMVVLADVEELSYKEIADIVGCPVGTVMSRLHRARKSLQVRLIDQAVALGISDAPKQSASAEPVVLSEFRSRKKVSS